MLVLQSILLSMGIDTFEFLKYIVKQYLCNGKTNDFEEERIIEIKSQKSCACTLDEFGLKFWPPLYTQRYMAIQEILENPIWNGTIKKVVDFGCAELSFFKYIKPVHGLNKIMLVDVDFNTLYMNQAKAVPTNYDHVSVHERTEPLIVDIYNGSIADLDDRMLGIDAVVCIELIEHLYSDVLNAVPLTVFEFIKPKLAVFTTPNVEFNILFPNFTKQFRHDDHKFEWTRKQFKEWAKKITTCYPEYAVQFDGIGAGPTGTEKLGCCSQMAIFYRKDMKTSPVNPIGFTPYKLLRRISFPFADENDVRERTLFDKVRKFVSEASINKQYIVNGAIEIPLSIILPCVSECCSSIDDFEHFVGKLYHTQLNNNNEWVLIKSISESSSHEYISDHDFSSNHSEPECSVVEVTENYQSDKEEDWNPIMDTSFDESKLCYSNSVFSNSELYKTAVDYRSEDSDFMDISCSRNSTILINDCKVYQDFVMGRNNSDLDISGKEDILTSVVKNNEFSSDRCKVTNEMNINEDIDMDISSSCNCSYNIDDCEVYQDFVTNRNNSTGEDISDVEKTLTSVVNNIEFCNSYNKEIP